MIGTGGTGHLNCSVHGGRGGGTTISWQHEGRPLHAPQSRLSLGPVRTHHGGLYQCTAHDHSESTVAGAELIIAGNLTSNRMLCKNKHNKRDIVYFRPFLVLAFLCQLFDWVSDRPPRLVSTFSEAVTRIGQTIALRCAATGVPSPRILWTLDDRPLPSAPDK